MQDARCKSAWVRLSGRGVSHVWDCPFTLRVPSYAWHPTLYPHLLYIVPTSYAWHPTLYPHPTLYLHRTRGILHCTRSILHCTFHPTSYAWHPTLYPHLLYIVPTSYAWHPTLYPHLLEKAWASTRPSLWKRLPSISPLSPLYLPPMSDIRPLQLTMHGMLHHLSPLARNACGRGRAREVHHRKSPGGGK